MKNKVVLAILLVVLANISRSQTTQYFWTKGTYTWTVPSGIFAIAVDCYGAGGGGGAGGTDMASGPTASAGGGGGGGHSFSVFAVLPGTTYTIIVGAGGAGGIGTSEDASTLTGNSGLDGGSSYFGTTVSATGGGGGQGSSEYASWGSAGCAAGFGGAGGNGWTGTGVPGQGGGPSSGGRGGNGVGIAGGAGGNGGGSVTSFSDADGNPGGAVGGGGGGCGAGAHGKGGNGADGMVSVEWNCPVYSFSAPPVATVVCGSGNASIITLTSTTLTEGDYTLTYLLDGDTTHYQAQMYAENTGSGEMVVTGVSSTTVLTITNILSGLSDLSGCSNAITANNTVIINVDVLTVTITPGGPTTFNYPGSVTLDAGSHTTYEWSNGAVTAAIDATTTGDYKVIVTDGNGCSAENTQQVTVLGAPETLLWSMADSGGTFGLGTVFSLGMTDTVYTRAYDFDGPNGAHPKGSLVQTADQKLYGMTSEGGIYNEGVIFCIDANRTYTKLYDFDGITGGHPQGDLTVFLDGLLYGMTNTGGDYGFGVLFNINPVTHAYSKLYSFDGVHGANPFGSLTLSNNGYLFGMASQGGVNGFGVAFRFYPVLNQYVDFLSFDGTNGRFPYGSFVQASDGKLYGLTRDGGANYSDYGIHDDNGVLFSVDNLFFNYQKYVDFGQSLGGDGLTLDAAHPYGRLTQGADGFLYGLTNGDVHTGSSGNLFKFDPASGVCTALVTFQESSGPNTQARPFGSLLAASDGNLYGMTRNGGYDVAAGELTGNIFGFNPVDYIFNIRSLVVPDGILPQFSSFIEADDYRVTAGSLPISACSGASFYVPFTIASPFEPDNVFTAQLSDANGDFTNAVNIGTLSSPHGGAIKLTVPASASPGSGYRIRINSSAPAVSGSPASNPVTINSVSAAISGTTTGCGSVTLSASGGVSYVWSGGSTPQSPTSSFTASGTYQVTVTGSNGCSLVVSQPVTVHRLPTAGIAGPSTGCDTVVLSIQGGASYQWSAGMDPDSAVNRFADTGITAVSVMVTDSNGCSASFSHTITVYKSPIAAIAPSAHIFLCKGQQVTLNADYLQANTGLTYQWRHDAYQDSIAGTESTLVADSAGSYGLFVTDAHGCSAHTTQTITVIPHPSDVIVADTAFSCADSILIDTHSGFSGFMWSTGDTGSICFARQTGWYSVSARDSTGCTDHDRIFISAVHAHIAASDTVACAGTPFQLSATGGQYHTIDFNGTTQYADPGVLPGIANNFSIEFLAKPRGSIQLPTELNAGIFGEQSRFILWPTHAGSGRDIFSNAGAGISFGQNGIVVAEHGGDYLAAPLVYAGTFSDYTHVMVVYEDRQPRLYVNGELVRTGLQSLRDSVWASLGHGDKFPGQQGGIGGGTYGYFDGLIDNFKLWDHALDSQEVAMRYADRYFPGAYADYDFNERDAVAYSSGALLLPAALVNGPTHVSYAAPAQYLWSTGDTASAITILPQASTTYFVTVSNDIQSCMDTMHINVLEKPSLTVSPSRNPLKICPGSTATLTASPGTSWTWNTGASTQGISVSQSGSYYASVTTEQGCSGNTDTIQVTVSALPQTLKIKYTGPASVCEPGTVAMSVDDPSGSTTGFAYQWNQNGNPVNGATGSIYTATATDNYSLTISGGPACSKISASKQATIRPLPSASFSTGDPLAFCYGHAVTFRAPALTGYTYQWLKDGVPAGSGEEKQFKLPGNYAVVARFHGCSDTASTQTVTVFPLPAAPVITAGDTSFCAGDSILLNAFPVTSNSYSWQRGTNTVVAAASASYYAKLSGNYRVAMTDANGCSSKPSAVPVKVRTRQLPAAAITPLGPATIGTGETVTLRATSASAIGYQWYKNGTPIAGGINRDYIATQPGDYSVAVTKNGCMGISATLTIIQIATREEQGLASSAPEETMFTLSAFPNPVSNVLTVNVRGVEKVDASLYLIDINGKRLSARKLEEHTASFDMSPYPAGAYIIRYTDDDGRRGWIKIAKE